MAIEIVEGQVLDLDFEGRADVTAADYLGMIAGKTAAIVRFAAWSGALLGGADEHRAARFGDFGRALGLGFQVRDDLLGIWGTTEATGKAAADDIRRRKQSLPILLLRDRASAGERVELDEILAAPFVPESGVARVLTLLDRHEVRTAAEERVVELHDQARAALHAALPSVESPAHHALLALVARMADRDR
jgi:geranylgeranyl diphosphate synthase type I